MIRPGSHRFAPHVIIVALVAITAIASFIGASAVPLADGDDDYNAAGFVLRHAWVKFGYAASAPLRDELSAAEEDARVERFFELNDLIGFNERIAGDATTDAALAAEASDRAQDYRGERANIENSVERILEGRLTDAVKRAGLTRRALGDIVWPPVSIEFEEPPSVLVRSPREVIRKDDESLVRGDLPIARVQEIEAQAEADGRTSALIVRIGAVATYPAIIPASASYHGTLETIAHEWMHHYLYFTPLGRRYFDNPELTTLNETLADRAGRELACFIDPCAAAARRELSEAGRAGAAPASQEFDFVAEMRALRREVEALLAEGEIETAEALMEETRRSFVENGYYLRRINQAYFAFHGSYADSAGSIDPIGPKLDDLRKQSASFEQFIETAREFRSERDLDAALRAP